MEWDRLRYIAVGSPRDMRVRVLAIVSILADTVTTLYILYFLDIPTGEFNPLILLTEYGFAGKVLFFSVPLFAVLAVFYIPGLFGDAVALAMVFLNAMAAGVNLVHSQGLPVEAVVGLPAKTVYLFIVTFGTGVGVLVYLPALYHRDQEYENDTN